MKKLVVVLIALFVLMSTAALADTLTIRPTGQGVYTDWYNRGCNSGSSEWQCVDEDPASTADYLYRYSKSRKETFSFADTDLSSEEINSVTMHYYAKRMWSRRYKMQPLLRISGSDYYGPIFNLGYSYSYYGHTYYNNPATGQPWTVAEINALEAGMTTPTSNYGAYVAQMFVEVDYTPSGNVTPDSCGDTDGGNVPLVFGTTSGFLDEVAYSSDDYCPSADDVFEYFCVGDYESSQQQSCGTDSYGSPYCISDSVYKDFTNYFCSGGECDFTTTPELQEVCEFGCLNVSCQQQPDSCSDTDGGNVPLVFGTTSGVLDEVPYSNDDYCPSADDVFEYFCVGNYENSQQQSCGTDFYGSLYCQGDDVYKDFTDYFCSGGECDSSVTPEFQETCEYGCSGGYCQSQPDSCSDTDGGNVPDVFGTVTGSSWGIPFEYNDYCVMDNTSVNEYFCLGPGNVSNQVHNCGTDFYGSPYCISDSVYKDFTDYFCSGGECDSSVTPEFQETCAFGCLNGTCQTQPDSCTDTDHGVIQAVQGTVSGTQGGIPFSYTDFCAGAALLNEYYCFGNEPFSTYVNCTNTTSACINGTCV